VAGMLSSYVTEGSSCYVCIHHIREVGSVEEVDATDTHEVVALYPLERVK
jgi:hypothetical protein